MILIRFRSLVFALGLLVVHPSTFGQENSSVSDPPPEQPAAAGQQHRGSIFDEGRALGAENWAVRAQWASDYRWRGFSLTGKDPTFFLTAHLWLPKDFFIGFQLAAVRKHDSFLELGAYFGYLKSFDSGWSYSLMGSISDYPNEKEQNPDVDILLPQLFALTTYTFQNFRSKPMLGGGIIWTGNWDGRQGDQIYVPTTAEIGLPFGGLRIYGAANFAKVTRTSQASETHYGYWNYEAGLFRKWSKVKIKLSYMTNRIDSSNPAAEGLDSTWLFTVQWASDGVLVN